MDTIQLVIFKLNGQEYGIDIFRVSEIVPYSMPTKIPASPVYVEGVLNLRGQIIPIINLKERFSMENSEADDRTRIIVTDINGNLTGFVVDDASEVLTVGENDIEPISDMASKISKKYISGVGKMDDGRLYILLNFDELYKEEVQ